MVSARHPFAAPAAPNPTRHESPMGWMDAATCASVDPLIWHPDAQDGTSPHLSAKAKAMCRWCPVARDCWDYTQAHAGLDSGIWAGMTYRDRREAYQAMAVGA
jgi:WhiB family redox-sensing transcriptional regulator